MITQTAIAEPQGYYEVRFETEWRRVEKRRIIAIMHVINRLPWHSGEVLQLEEFIREHPADYRYVEDEPA